MVTLWDHPEGVLLPVKAQAGGRKNAIRGEQNGALQVSVTQVAEKGKANGAIASVLASELKLKPAQIELIAGQTQPQKRFLIRGVSHEELAARIASALGSS
jgi:uncharacterized protein YggU (UPF0235/DUF167 family)